MKTEVVSRELLGLCLSLLEHIQKMRKCSYIAESHKAGKYGTIVTFKYMSTRDGSQIHELDDAGNHQEATSAMRITQSTV